MRKILLAGLLAAVFLSGVIADAAGPAPSPPLLARMLASAHAMQAASAVLLAERRARGLMPPREADPNQTGLIGFEYTPMTTAPGDLEAKRTLTNPDTAAALVRLIAPLDLPPGSAVVMVISGSSMGANIGAIAAVEALGLSPIILASTGASMWGANSPQFNLLDMMARLREAGVIRSHIEAAVLGGEDAIGAGMDKASLSMLRASAARHAIPIVEAKSLPAIVDALMRHLDAALLGARPGLLISVGGSVIALGNCLESFTFPIGLSQGERRCGEGFPGILMRQAGEGTPTLYINSVKRLAPQLGLPLDPMPLPEPGKNAAIYGAN